MFNYAKPRLSNIQIATSQHTPLSLTEFVDSTVKANRLSKSAIRCTAKCTFVTENVNL